MDMALILILMGLSTKAIGKKISKMDWERKLGLMELVTKVIIDKVENQVKANLDGQMDQNMKVTFSRIIFMEKVNINIITTKKGMYTWNDRRQFVGDWVQNKMDGEGIFIWPDDRKYQGQYKDDKKEGYGIFEWL